MLYHLSLKFSGVALLRARPRNDGRTSRLPGPVFLPLLQGRKGNPVEFPTQPQAPQPLAEQGLQEFRCGASKLVHHLDNLSAPLVTTTTWKQIRKRDLPVSHPPGDLLPVLSQPCLYQLEIGRGRLDPSKGHPLETLVKVCGHPRVQRKDSSKNDQCPHHGIHLPSACPQV